MIVHEIQITLFEHGHRRGLFVDHVHGDSFQVRLATKEVRVGAELDLIFVTPTLQTKRSVGHDIFRLGPAVAEFFDYILPLRKSDLETGDREKIRGRVTQRNEQSLIIPGLNADQ